MADEIGRWIPAGIAVGIDANANSITEAMNDMSDLMIDDAASLHLDAQPTGFEPVANRTITFAPVMNVYPPAGASNEEIANIAVDIMIERIQSEDMTWA